MITKMPTNTDWYIQIDDGELHKVEGVYDGGLGNGGYATSNEHTMPEDKVRHTEPSGIVVGLVSAYWETPDGGIDGVEGIYKRVKWAAHPDNDCPIFRVWERIA